MVEAGRRGVGVAVGALVVVGCALRLWRLGDQGLWYDEWLTARGAGGGFGDMGQHVAHVEGIGPAYLGLMWGWVQLFGDSVVSLRLVSVICGVATIPAVYAAARALGLRRSVGLVAAVVVTVHPMLVWYSREARPYSLLVLCGALSLVLFGRARTAAAAGSEPVARRAYLAWGVLAAAAVAVHHFAVFLFLVEGAVLVRAAWGRPRVAVVAVVPPLLTAAALVPLAASQFSDAGSSWIAGFPYVDRLEDVGVTALIGPSTPDGRWWLPGALAVVVAVGLLATVGRRDRAAVVRTAGMTAGLGVAAVLLAVLATLVGPDVLVSRYLIASLAPLVVAVAAGLAPGGWPAPGGAAGPGRRLVGALPTVLGAVALTGFVAASLVVVVQVADDPDLQKPDWQAVADVVGDGDGGEPRAVVMNLHGHQGSPLEYHLGRGRSLDEDDSDDGARVREIDVLVSRPTDPPCNYLVGRACALIFLGATLPPDIAARVTLHDRVVLDQFVIERYRAAHPIRITPASLLGPDASNGLVFVFRTTP
jgi:4-amino-4-deoxy-L-arabinose transferase-like glycosyltransferase